MTPDDLVHQLNNDLAIAMGRLMLLVGESDLTPTVELLAARALTATERAVALVESYGREASRPAARAATRRRTVPAPAER